jgi:hypothetical protein
VLDRFAGKSFHWLGGYARHLVRQALARRTRGPRHVLFALCDHFEPLHGEVSQAVGAARVRAWALGYPKLAAEFRDADGRPPRHSFFFPGEQYDPAYLEPLADLARAGLGEVELHLHHDGDTAESLERALRGYLGAFERHGHLARDADGRPRYGFIHGDWCLANSRRDRTLCGVDAELLVLHRTGCYADFTFPSPDETQPRMVNQIYWPEGDLGRARAYEQGTPARVGDLRHDRVLMVQGPLAIARVPRPGHLPIGIESGHLTAVEPANRARVRAWLAQDIHVAGRPEWLFVKVHTHGAPEPQAASLLGDGGRTLHHELRAACQRAGWQLHYVTAREMYNCAIAAMAGHAGEPRDAFDYALSAPPCAVATAAGS